ncbi:hypothetical protein D4Z78_30545 [Okeania hirsuta]|nr:hypothetical protein D4Z78_30545 [Okeania hirsuta]
MRKFCESNYTNATEFDIRGCGASFFLPPQKLSILSPPGRGRGEGWVPYPLLPTPFFGGDVYLGFAE